METEHLKLIIELLRDAGETTAWVAGAYVVAPVIETVIISLVLAFTAVTVTTKIANAVIKNTICAKAWIAVAVAAGHDTADAIPTTGEVNRVTQRIAGWRNDAATR